MNSIITFIKTIIELLLFALVVGAIGASALKNNLIIIGAVCFIVSGFILGMMFGYFIANIDSSDEGSNDIL